MDILHLLMDKIKNGDRDGGFTIIEEWKNEHPQEDVSLVLLEPFLLKVGILWQSGQISLAQSYTATKIVEDVVDRLIERRADDANNKGTVVIGNVEEDFHGLGRRMVSSFLKANNWEVRNLGNDVAAEDFVDAAVEAGAHVIAVSNMMYTTAQNIIKIRHVIDERELGSKIKLAVGGAVFRLRPELVSEVGGDGTAISAMEAPKLIESLWSLAERGEWQ